MVLNLKPYQGINLLHLGGAHTKEGFLFFQVFFFFHSILTVTRKWKNAFLTDSLSVNTNQAALFLLMCYYLSDVAIICYYLSTVHKVCYYCTAVVKVYVITSVLT